MTHCFDVRADSFKWKCLPAREERELVVVEELAQIIVKLAGHGPRWACNEERPAIGERAKRGDRNRAGDLDHGEARLGITERTGEAWFISQQACQRPQGRGCWLFIAHHVHSTSLSPGPLRVFGEV